MEENMNNEIMETKIEVAENQDQADCYQALAENDESTGGSFAGFVKLAALGVGGFVLAKKFVWDKKIKPAFGKRRAAKKAEEEARREAEFERWAIKKGLLVPTEAEIEETDDDVCANPV